MTLPAPRRRCLCAALAASALPSAGLARTATAYPSRPVRIVVGLPAGGVADMATRVLAAAMQPALGQPLVVENRPGAGFQLALQAVTQAAPDGHTLVNMVSAMLSAQAVHKRFDVFRSLVPIAGTGATDTTLAVGKRSPHRTVQQLIAWARARPGRMTYGSPGAGTPEHLALHHFCKRYGIEAVHVPFKGGPEVMHALAAGHIDLGTQAVPLIVQSVPPGMVRALVVLKGHRHAAIPDVPTIEEAGLDIDRLTLWGGLAAPAETPPDVVALLEHQVLAAMKSPELIRQYLQMGIEPRAESAGQFGQAWKDDWAWISRAASAMPLGPN